MRENKPIEFKDDEESYQLWLQENPNGFVLNTNKYHFSKLHSADCYTIKNRQIFTSNGVFKVCSLEKLLLKNWCKKKWI
jgi:hypothetical protein